MDLEDQLALLQQIQAATAERDTADQQAAQAREQWLNAIHEAGDSGIPRASIARAAKVTPGRITQLLTPAPLTFEETRAMLQSIYQQTGSFEAVEELLAPAAVWRKKADEARTLARIARHERTIYRFPKGWQPTRSNITELLLNGHKSSRHKGEVNNSAETDRSKDGPGEETTNTAPTPPPE